MSTDLFQSYVHDKTQPKDQLRKSWEVPILLCKWELQSKKFLVQQGQCAVLIDLGEGRYHIITKYDIIGSIK
jgi:cystathionine beta-synthase